MVGWFCLQSCKLDGDLLLGLMDCEETGTVSSGFVQSWSLACERNDSVISKSIFQSAQGLNTRGASALLEHPNSNFLFHMEAKHENYMPKHGCSNTNWAVLHRLRNEILASGSTMQCETSGKKL